MTEPDVSILKAKTPIPAKPTTPKDWRAMKWLTIGLGIKRYALLVAFGLLLVIIGAALAFAYVASNFSLDVVRFVQVHTHIALDSEGVGFACITLGATAVAVGWRGVLIAVEKAYSGSNKRGFLETALQKKNLDRGERLVAIGGGTGLSTMLRGLKEHTSNITAIVTMADDGGSSGKLREHGMLPPGDLRNCIAALAETEPLMTELFDHRFKGLGDLKGHSLGNLIVAAMFEITNDFDEAVQKVSTVLAIRGRVFPSTVDDIRLGAILNDGTRVEGQVNVNQSENIEHIFLMPAAPQALPGAVKAIQEAEIIVIGPGSLFTSIIPNLLVPEIAEALKASKAPKIYVCNVMTQPNETKGFKASDHVKAIVRHIGKGVVTHVLVNNAKVPEEILERYRQAGADYIEPDETAIEMLGVRPIHGGFIDVSNVVRHHPHKLASAVFKIAARI